MAAKVPNIMKSANISIASIGGPYHGSLSPGCQSGCLHRCLARRRSSATKAQRPRGPEAREAEQHYEDRDKLNRGHRGSIHDGNRDSTKLSRGRAQGEQRYPQGAVRDIGNGKLLWFFSRAVRPLDPGLF